MADIELTRFIHETMPLTKLLGVEAIAASADEVRARLPWDESRCTSNGLMHGGAVMALADTCGGWCAFLNLPEGAAGTATVESKTNFLRGITKGDAVAVSRVLHAGRTFIVVDTEVRDGDGRLAARVTQTQAVLRA